MINKLKEKAKGIIGITLAVSIAVGGSMVPALLSSESARAAGTSLSVDMDPSTAGIQDLLTELNPTDTFDVDIVLDTDEATIGAQVMLAWTPGVIDLMSVSQGTFYSTGGFMTPNPVDSSHWDNTAGECLAISVNQISSQAAGTGTVLTYSFQAQTNGTADIWIVEDDPELTGIQSKVMDEAGENIDPLTLNDGAAVVGPLPDLEVTDKVENWVDEAAGTYIVSYAVHNASSTTPAGSFDMGLYVDDVLLTTETVTELAADGTYSGTFGDYVVTLSDGFDTIKVSADVNGDVMESDEDNNDMINSFPRPDVIVEVDMIPGDEIDAERVVSLGEVFDVDVVIDSAVETIGAQTAVEFDADKLQCLSVSWGTFYGGTQVPTDPSDGIDNVNGRVEICADVLMGTIQAAQCDVFLVLEFASIGSGIASVMPTDVLVMDTSAESITSLEVLGGDAIIECWCETTLAGNPIATIRVTCPESLDPWNLRVGMNGYVGTLNVKCNTDWVCMVSDEDDVNTSGHMSEHDGSSYVGGEQLDIALRVKNMDQGQDVSLSNTREEIANGTPALQPGNQGQNFDVEFVQQVQYDDPVLDDGNQYEIVVTFTGYVV